MNFRIASSVLAGAAAFTWIVTAHCAQAAMISVEPSVSGQPALVFVDGDLEPGDGDQFRFKTSFLSKATIAFRSNGGDVVAGIQIGESIRLKGFATAVTGTAHCASACALAWLGGVRRFMGAEARIGFHAAYNTEGRETGVGNALIGAYLNKIGLPYNAVIYITKASPDSMTWLSVADAEKRGIEVEVSSSPRIQNATGASPAPGLPVAPAQRAQEDDMARRKAQIDACIRIQDEEIKKASQCMCDKLGYLIGNRTDGAAVVAEAIIGTCRATFSDRMSQRSQSLQCDWLHKAQDRFFAQMRVATIERIVDSQLLT
jgi:hypothetical protein